VQRKAFHLLAVLIFLPGALLDPTLLMLASVGAVCVVAVLEAVRVTRAPLLGAAVHRFMYQFVDERDGGAVILTHLYLLLGCAAPLWLHYSLLPSQPTRLELLPALSGVLVLGVGDSAASLFGVALGRSRWGGGSHKTIEGSLAMFFAVVGCAGAIAPDAVAHRGLWAASALATLVEAWTDQIDNLILPLVFYSALVATGVAVA
jgi:dolichol kinase